MANQPSKYKKFVVTAASAALVASAVAPVASAAEYTDTTSLSVADMELVTKATDLGFFQGDGSKFNPYNQITRGQVVKVLARQVAEKAGKTVDAYYADNNLATKVAPFSDVPATHVDKELFKSSLIVKDAGVFEGNNNELKFSAYINRQQMASVLVRAFDLKAVDGKTSTVTDSNNAGSHKVNIDILSQNGVTVVTEFNPLNNLSRLQMARFVVRAHEVSSTVVVAPKVVSVSAANTTTLTLTGEGLNNLEASDLSVTGNTVTSVVADAKGKSATVTLSSALLPNQENTLTVKADEKETTFKFTYTLSAVKDAKVTAGTFDDDTKGQQVKLLVNGSAADFDALKVAGYSVDFVAVNSSNVDVSSTLFKDEETGALADVNVVGDYTVQVTITKGSLIVVSEKETIKVRNLELAASQVKSYTLTNSAVAGDQMSTSFIVGESANFSELVAVANGVEFDVTDTAKIGAKSSNPAVISVDSSGVMTANTPGTAVVTITYGDVKKDVTFTVANGTRNFAKATPNEASKTIIGTGNANVTVSATDQFGDLISGQTISVVAPSNGVVSAPASAVTNADGKATVAITGATAGSGVVLFKNASGTTLGSVGVKVTAVNNVVSSKLEVVPSILPQRSADNKLDISADNTVVYALNHYSSENVPNGSADLSAGYTVKYNANIVTIGAPAAGEQTISVPGTTLDITAKNVGSTDVAVYNSSNVLVSKVTITVSNTGYSISSVDFKAAPTINYIGKKITANDVITTTASNNDDIVKGIVLSKPTAHQIRVSSVDELYIDADGNGVYTAGEVILGKVTGSVATGVIGTWAPAGPFANVFSSGVTTAAAGDKGTVIFKVEDNSGKILASTSVTVDVK